MKGCPARRSAILVLLFPIALECGGCAISPARGTDDDAGRIVVTQVPGPLRPARSAERMSLGQRYPEGSRVIVVDMAAPTGQRRVLSRGLVAAGGPALSPDSRSVLFAGRERNDSRWAIYEASVERGGPRKIVELDRDCGDPAYLTGGAVLFACAEHARASSSGHQVVWSLYVTARDDHAPDRITYGVHSAFDPRPMLDGRVLFSMGRGGGTNGNGTALFTVNPDGSLLSALSGHHEDAALAHRARETADGAVVYLAVDPDDGPVRLERLDLARPEQAPREIPLLMDIASELVTLEPSAVEPLRDGGFLVAGRPAEGPASPSTMGIYRLAADGEPLTPAFDDPDWHELEAVPLLASPPPRGRPSGLHDRPGTATLICYDVNRSDGKLGPADGSLRAATIVVQQPHESAANDTQAVDIGTAVVAQDGSLFVDVPSETPIRVRSLDGAGQEIATSDWFWLRSGEVRACFGCHEGHANAPVNRALAALSHDAVTLTPPEATR